MRQTVEDLLIVASGIRCGLPSPRAPRRGENTGAGGSENTTAGHAAIEFDQLGRTRLGAPPPAGTEALRQAMQTISGP